MTRTWSHPNFLPIFETAAKLRVPFYIHPQIPQRAVREALYSGFGDQIDTAFAAFGLEWHYEAGPSSFSLDPGERFDEHAHLQVVLGHWGEVVLFYVEQLGSLARVAKCKDR